MLRMQRRGMEQSVTSNPVRSGDPDLGDNALSRTLADWLAAAGQRGAVMPLPLHILQLLLGHAEIMTEFMYESLANLMTNFCFVGADRLNVFLIDHDVGRTSR
jgi:hypothetical protein